MQRNESKCLWARTATHDKLYYTGSRGQLGLRTLQLSRGHHGTRTTRDRGQGCPGRKGAWPIAPPSIGRCPYEWPDIAVDSVHPSWWKESSFQVFIFQKYMRISANFALFSILWRALFHPVLCHPPIPSPRPPTLWNRLWAVLTCLELTLKPW